MQDNTRIQQSPPSGNGGGGNTSQNPNLASSNNLKSYIQDLKKVAQNNKNKRAGVVQGSGSNTAA